MRHNNGGAGESYGGTYTQGDTIGVYVDLIEGTLFFSKNGYVHRIAFKTDKLLKCELYPACCCLSKGDEFKFLMPSPED